MKPLAQSCGAERAQTWSVPHGDEAACGIEPHTASGGPARERPSARPGIPHGAAGSAVCGQIRAAYASLTRTERRVADVVLANPVAALETATARLAEAAQVSQPQVIRFCRAVGYDGVSSLKRALAMSLANADVPTHHPLLTRSLQALGHLDRGRLAEAARLLAGAGQIDVLTDAARAPLLDFALRALWRLGLTARPTQATASSQVSACLALGACPGLPVATVLIVDTPQPSSSALQLVTGLEPAAAPTLLATLMLQLLLAELAPAALSAPRAA